jgi:glutamine amidotransferase-like uncharacterized protein
MEIIKNRLIAVCCLFLFGLGQAFAQVPKPEDVFGFKPGADYKLAMYSQFMDYYTKLDAASDRVKMVEIGKTVLGKPMIILFISSEENIKNLEKYRLISEQMARARISGEQAEKNAIEGKAIIWIDGGLHSTEVAGGQMTPELAYNLATQETREVKKIREEVITILMPMMNPDGLDIVASWYYQHLGTPFEVSYTPWLYHHYIGHDNNRDWFMNNMPESYNVNEVLYNQWYPQIVYNHHQTSPSWARIFIPPFDNPVNPKIHPGVTTATNLIGTVMGNRFAMERMPGVISHQRFSMWWNGGMRTVPYFHNMVGILTETAHASATPRFYPPDSVPKFIGGGAGGTPSDGTMIFYSDPWKGGESHLRDAVDYMLTGTMAVLDIAADRKYEYLINIYRMGRDAIDAKVLENTFAYVIPKKQHDANEAVNLVNVLRQGGVEVYVADKAFTSGDKSYDAGSFIIYGAQAFRPYVVDLLEKQEHPDMYQYPGGPPVPPYDLAGWTLPMQMGVSVDKHMNAFKTNATEIKTRATYAAGNVSGKGSFGFSYSPNPNASAKITNILLAAGYKVHRIMSAAGENAAGTFVVESGEGLADKVALLSKSEGIDFTTLAAKPAGELKALSLPKVGLYKSWRANMDEGWTRWLLTEYAFQWDTLHDDDIRNKDLSIYHAIIIPDQDPETILHGHRPGTMPEQYVGGMGLMGANKLNQYVINGGTLITFDEASDFAINQFGLPVENVVAGKSPNQFFIPGSLIRTDVNTNNHLAFGVESEVAASFSRSRAFKILSRSNKMEGGTITTLAPAEYPKVDVVASYAKDNLLMSGWALGEKRTIGGQAAILDAKHGNGNIVLFGFRPQFRGQPRATYQLFFNAMINSTID